jgi:signal transduction histidine kinase
MVQGIHAAFDIWYVASRDDNARRLAEAVNSVLFSRGVKVGALIPVRRGIAGDTWAFPSGLDRADTARPAVIIGWSAMTGTTLLQMTRIAASSGASHVVAVSMLNQLDPQDAAVLGMLRAVSASPVGAELATQIGEDSSAQRTRSIPVSIRFVAVSSITAPGAHDCAVCATQERYEVSSEDAPPRLRRHAERLREMLQPRGSEEVSRDAAADLFTVPISGDDVVDYLRWRGLLLRALRDLSARQEVVEHLEMPKLSKSKAEWSRPGLIRLLAAEQQWLKLPPLRFTVARNLLAEACIGGLEQSLATPPWLRVQALIVLCATAPERLTELVPRLLSHVVDEAVLVDELLFDCYRLMLRPPRDSPIDVEQLRQNLVQCRDYLEDAPEGCDAELIDDYRHVVGELITIADYRIMQKPNDARAAWERLREDLMRSVIRHSLESDLLLVRSFVEDLEEVRPTPESARAARADWDICARQLQERALVNLPALRDIISGEYVSDLLGRKEQHRLLSLAHADAQELRAVTDRLHALTYEPWRPKYPPWQDLRRELLDRINWWNRVFVAAHVPDSHAPALLVNFVGSAPCRLGSRVSSTLAAHGADVTFNQPENGEVLVFCPEKLLDQMVGHLVDNVERHCTPGANCRMYISYEHSGPEHIQLVLRNSGTKPRTPAGQGLKALNDKLRPFGGELIGRVVLSDEWTFEAVAKLPLWNRR